MQPRPLVVLVVATVAVAVAWWQQNGAGSPPALCLVDPIYEAKPGQQTECFFSPSFQQASSLFKDAARAAGAHMVVGLEVTKHHNITVAVFEGDPSNDGVVLHISGTHGPEGYVGSAVQSGWLNTRITSNKDENEAGSNPHPPPAPSGSRPTVILVHALNPVGMAQMRRVNEANVDLNRNCLLNNEGWADVLKRDPDAVGYAAVDKYLNPPHPAEGAARIAGIFGLLSHIISVGWIGCKRALVTGQYSHPKGIFYGGTELSTSHKQLSTFLNRLPQVTAAKRLVLVDVHSGLGPPAQDTLMTSDGDFEKVSRIFGAGATLDANLVHTVTEAAAAAAAADAADARAGAADVVTIPGPYEIQGNVTSDDTSGGAAAGYDVAVGCVDTESCYKALFTSVQWSAVFTQEFGTTGDDMTILDTMIRENACHHWCRQSGGGGGGGGGGAKAANARRMRDAFAPVTHSFQSKALVRGILVLKQAVDALSTPSEQP